MCWCRGRHVQAGSQRLIDNGVDVAAEPHGVEGWESAEPFVQDGGHKGTPGQWPELGDRLTVAGDDDVLAAGHTRYDLTSAVPQLPDARLGHTTYCITRETSAGADRRVAERTSLLSPTPAAAGVLRRAVSCLRRSRSRWDRHALRAVVTKYGHKHPGTGETEVDVVGLGVGRERMSGDVGVPGGRRLGAWGPSDRKIVGVQVTPPTPEKPQVRGPFGGLLSCPAV